MNTEPNVRMGLRAYESLVRRVNGIEAGPPLTLCTKVSPSMSTMLVT